MATINWTGFSDDSQSFRAKVPGGWLYKRIWHITDAVWDVGQNNMMYQGNTHERITFISDPDYTWDMINLLTTAIGD